MFVEGATVIRAQHLYVELSCFHDDICERMFLIKILPPLDWDEIGHKSKIRVRLASISDLKEHFVFLYGNF